MYYGYQLDRDLLASLNGKTCTEADFTWSWDIYGNCYTFKNGNETTELLKTSATLDVHESKD
jgi:hypothetical protein